jgi:hypothetical protein
VPHCTALLHWHNQELKTKHMEKNNLVVLDVTKDGVKAHGPLNELQAVTVITRLMEDQPMKIAHEVPRVWVANLETGEIKKPILKVTL